MLLSECLKVGTQNTPADPVIKKLVVPLEEAQVGNVVLDDGRAPDWAPVPKNLKKRSSMQVQASAAAVAQGPAAAQ